MADNLRGEINFPLVKPKKLKGACARDQFKALQGLNALAEAINSGRATLQEVRRKGYGSSWTFITVMK